MGPLDGAGRVGHLRSRARGAGQLGNVSSAAGARVIPSPAWLHARVHYAASLCQSAGHMLRFAAPRSGVLQRLVMIRGSFGRSL